MEAKQCPLCGEPNGCKAGTAKRCWCHDIKIPKGLLQQIPQEKQGKVCICKACIEAYNTKRSN